MPRGTKRVIDVERQVDETSELTDNELRAMTAETTARLAAMRQRWEATGDLHALIGALIFFQSRLPEWLFKGLILTALHPSCVANLSPALTCAELFILRLDRRRRSPKKLFDGTRKRPGVNPGPSSFRLRVA